MIRTKIGKIIIVFGLALAQLSTAKGPLAARTSTTQSLHTEGPAISSDANQKYMICAERLVSTLNACVRRAELKVAEARACRRQFLARLTFDLARCEKQLR